MFTPSRTQRPVPTEQLEDRRRTTVRFRNGETVFRTKKGA